MPPQTTRSGMSVEDVRRLPVAFELDAANRAFGIGRTTGYALAKRGEYPVPVLRLGNAYRVRRADVLTLLGIAENA